MDFNPKKFLLLEGRVHGKYEYPDTLVAKALCWPGHVDRGKYHHSLDNAVVSLHQQGGFHLLTPRQFIDFVKLLQSGKAYNGRGNPADPNELKVLLRGIMSPDPQVRPCNELLDMAFYSCTWGYHCRYNHRVVEGETPPFDVHSEGHVDLTDFLMLHIEREDFRAEWERGAPFYADVLGSANDYGLPTKKRDSGSGIMYSPPKGFGIAQFGTMIAEFGFWGRYYHHEGLCLNCGEEWAIAGVRKAVDKDKT